MPKIDFFDWGEEHPPSFFCSLLLLLLKMSLSLGICWGRARVRKFLRHDAFLRNGLAVLHSMDADWLVVGLEFDLNNEDKVYDSIAILKHLALQLLNCIKIAIRCYQDKFCFKSRLQFFYLYLRINIFDKGSWFEFKWRGK